MKKKFLSLLLVLCFVMAFGSITALAAEGQTTDIWDGTADTSWYTGHETESEYPYNDGRTACRTCAAY